MSAFYNLSNTPRNILNQAIVRAIVSENNGAWFDPSDLSTLYQDAAGTIPVTAVEQPVGKMLDKSGNGYHATQPITASRPTLSARKNILLATETLATQSVTTLAATYTLSFTGAGSVALSGTATGTLTGNGTDRVSLTFTPTAGTLTLTVSGSVTKAQLGLGSVVTSYQRVTTATDYDVSAHYYYLRFDGVDDYLNLPYMGLYANGSASVVVGKSTAPQKADAVILSERNNAIGNTLYLLRYATVGSVLDYYARRDDGAVILNSIGFTESVTNISNVVSYIDTGSSIIQFENSTQKKNESYTRTAPLTPDNTLIGASKSAGGVVSFLTGNIYSLIITKSALTDAQRIKCERDAASKAGVIL